MFLEFLLYFFGFAAADRLLTLLRLQGVYYLIHGVHNAIMVYHTWNDVALTFTNFHALDQYPVNMSAVVSCSALHLYHIALYYNKLRYDDWLHHGLMIFVALPLGAALPSTTLLGYSLFFTTGLPGLLDYILLFGVRNGWVAPLFEKRVNRCINVWLRSPGCVSHATLVFAYILSGGGANRWMSTIGLLPPLLTLWNGQYFMDQVVTDYEARKNAIMDLHPL